MYMLCYFICNHIKVCTIKIIMFYNVNYKLKNIYLRFYHTTMIKNWAFSKAANVNKNYMI